MTGASPPSSSEKRLIEEADFSTSFLPAKVDPIAVNNRGILLSANVSLTSFGSPV